MNNKIKNFLVSGHDFNEFEVDVKYRFQIINIGLVLFSVAMLYGIIGNLVRDIKTCIVPFEGIILFILLAMVFLLRKYRWILQPVAVGITALFLFLSLLFIYFGNPINLMHIWVIMFPVILLYTQCSKRMFFWVLLMTIFLVIAPIQPFLEVEYSLYQVTYIAFILIIEGAMIYLYQIKMDEEQKLILEQQQKMHLEFNSKLEEQVKEKTSALIELNESLEIKVAQKVEEITRKDQILEVQSKQAVMGEMISMIAHQWRQPLSTITLQIANLQVDRLLGKETSDEDTENALSGISDTIVYLSETIDDFLTYFHPSKELVEVEVHELLQKAVNFAIPRVKGKDIDITIDKQKDVNINTYTNEFVQVVLNILNNAIDAIKETDNEKSYVNMSVNVVDKFVYIDITDNAGGIDNDFLPKLFEPYFSTKGKNGTGLGLYMSQMIVQKQFNGNIEVQSSKNGTTFTIKVPSDLI